MLRKIFNYFKYIGRPSHLEFIKWPEWNTDKELYFEAVLTKSNSRQYIIPVIYWEGQLRANKSIGIEIGDTISVIRRLL